MQRVQLSCAQKLRVGKTNLATERLIGFCIDCMTLALLPLFPPQASGAYPAVFPTVAPTFLNLIDKKRALVNSTRP
jgi:hypothetical protein